jgi:hypothetical protein
MHLIDRYTTHLYHLNIVVKDSELVEKGSYKPPISRCHSALGHIETTAFHGSGSVSHNSEERRGAGDTGVTGPNNMVIGSVFPPSGGTYAGVRICMYTYEFMYRFIYIYILLDTNMCIFIYFDVYVYINARIKVICLAPFPSTITVP